MRKDDAEGEAGCGAHREADCGLLRRERGRLQEYGDEQRTLEPRGSEEGMDDVVQVGHRRVVHDERPRPVFVDPQAAVALPETPEDRQH